MLFQIKSPRFAVKPRTNSKWVRGGGATSRGASEAAKSGAETAISAAAAGGKLVMRAPVVVGMVATKGAMAAAVKGIAGANALRAAASKRLGGVARRSHSSKLSRDSGVVQHLATQQSGVSLHLRPLAQRDLAAHIAAAEGATLTEGERQEQEQVCSQEIFAEALSAATPSEVTPSEVMPSDVTPSEAAVSELESESMSEMASEIVSDEESDTESDEESKQVNATHDLIGGEGVVGCDSLIVSSTSPQATVDIAFRGLALAPEESHFRQTTSALAPSIAAVSRKETKRNLDSSDCASREAGMHMYADHYGGSILGHDVAPSQCSPHCHASPSPAVAPHPFYGERGVAPPLLLSGKHVSLSLGGGEWSKPLPCEAAGASWSVSLADHEFGVEVRTGLDKAPRSRLVLVQPLYQLLNRSGLPLRYRTKGGPQSRGVLSCMDAAHATPVAFHWDVAASHSTANEHAVGSGATRLLQLALMKTPDDAPNVQGGALPCASSDSLPENARSSLVCEESSWSGAFTINGPGDSGHVIAVPELSAFTKKEEVPMRVASSGSPRHRLILVTVEQCGPSVVVCFDIAPAAPFRLHNECSFAIAFSQDGASNASEYASITSEAVFCRRQTLRPGDSVDYTWEEPIGQHMLTLVPIPPPAGSSAAAIAHPMRAQHGGFKLNPEHVAEVEHGHPPLFWSSVLLEGGPLCKAVRFSERSPAMLAANGEQLGNSLSCLLGSVGISLVDTAKRHELLYCRAQALHFSLMQTELEYEAQLQLERLQLDAQTPHAFFPVVVLGQGAGSSSCGGSTSVYAQSGATTSMRPWLLCSLRKRRAEKRLRSVVFAIAELRLHLEERFLYACLSFASRALPAPPRVVVHPNANAVPLSTFPSPRFAPTGSPSGLSAMPPSPVAVKSCPDGDGAIAISHDEPSLAPAPAPVLLMPSFELPKYPLPTPLIERKRPWYVDELCIEELRVQALPLTLPIPTSPHTSHTRIHARIPRTHPTHRSPLIPSRMPPLISPRMPPLIPLATPLAHPLACPN